MSRLVFKDTTITNNDTVGLESAFDKPIGYKIGEVPYDNMKPNHFVTKDHLEGVVGGGMITESDHNTQYVYQKIFDYCRANEIAFRNASQMQDSESRALNELDYITKQERDAADLLILAEAKLYTDENSGGGGGISQAYVDEHDAATLEAAKTYAEQYHTDNPYPIAIGGDEIMEHSHDATIDVDVRGDVYSMNYLISKMKLAGHKYTIVTPNYLIAEEVDGEYVTSIRYTENDIGMYRDLFAKRRNGTLTENESKIFGSIVGAVMTGISWLPKISSVLSGLFGGKRPQIGNYRFSNARASMDEMKTYLSTINPNFVSHVRQNGSKLFQNILKQQYEVGITKGGLGKLVKEQLWTAAREWQDNENKWKMNFPQRNSRRIKNLYVEINYDMEVIENDNDDENVGIKGFTVTYGSNLYDKLVVEIGDYIMDTKADADTLKSQIENTLDDIMWGDHKLDKKHIKLLNNGPLLAFKVVKYTNYYTVNAVKYHDVFTCTDSGLDIAIDGLERTGAFITGSQEIAPTEFGMKDKNIINGSTSFIGNRLDYTVSEINDNPDLDHAVVDINGPQVTINHRDLNNNVLPITLLNDQSGNNYIGGGHTFLQAVQNTFTTDTYFRGWDEDKTKNVHHLQVGLGNGNHIGGDGTIGYNNDMCHLKINGGANASGDGFTYFPHNNDDNTADGAFSGTNLIRGDTHMDKVGCTDFRVIGPTHIEGDQIVLTSPHTINVSSGSLAVHDSVSINKHLYVSEIKKNSSDKSSTDEPSKDDYRFSVSMEEGDVATTGKLTVKKDVDIGDFITLGSDGNIDCKNIEVSHGHHINVGTDIELGSNGNIKANDFVCNGSITLGNETYSTWPTNTGDKGEKGDPGEKGEKGDPGEVGADGKNGADGIDGESGVFTGGLVSGDTTFNKSVHIEGELFVQGLVFFSTVIDEVIKKPHDVEYYWFERFHIDGNYFHENDYDIVQEEQYHHNTNSDRNVGFGVKDGYWGFNCAVYHPHNDGTGWYTKQHVHAKYSIARRHGNKLRNEVDVLKEKIEKLELLVVNLQN